jgi:hypothetical protein
MITITSKTVYLFVRMIKSIDVNAAKIFVYKNRFKTNDVEDINKGGSQFAFTLFDRKINNNFDYSLWSFQLYQHTNNDYKQNIFSKITQVEIENWFETVG